MNLLIKYISIITLCLLASCHTSVKDYEVGVSQCSDDSWRQQMNAEMVRQTFLLDDCNIKLEFRSSHDNSKQQIDDINYFIEKGVDLIAVAPNEAEALTPVIERAYDKGIPVVVVDRKISSEKFTAFVGSDNYVIGRAVAEFVNWKFQKPTNIVELTGLKNSTPAIERTRGFNDYTSPNANINIVAVADAAWDAKVAFAKMDSILSKRQDIDVVFAHNDPMAMAAYSASKKHGLADRIKFIGIDALYGDSLGMGLVKKGVLMASFVYPTGGDMVVDVATAILTGKPYQRMNLLGTAVVDSTSVAGLILQTKQIYEQAEGIELLNNRIIDFSEISTIQKVLLYVCLAALLLAVAFLFTAHKMLRLKNRLNSRLENQKLQLESQKSQLESQNEQLVKMSKELEDATQAKLVFFTNISHDFRTPLTLVADPIEQLLNTKNISVNDRKLLKIAHKNTGILLRLVNQILDFRKYENGKMELSAEPLDLLACFKRWNESFMTAVVKNHLHLHFIADGDKPYATIADREKIERIYFNLISNALKFTPANGDITVRLEHKVIDGARHISFSVHNTGSIISAEHINKIFDRFYMTDVHHAGSGIGLALVKALVELHHGTITVESSEKGGTVFHVCIPEIECEVPADISSQAATDANSETAELDSNDEDIECEVTPDKPVVLIIDDNQDIRNYVNGLLSDTYSVIEAASALEGIKKANRYVPDLIVCDIMMPGIDGLECCRRLKADMHTCHIPVMMLTACSLDEQRIKGYSCGADSYIAKPFSSSLLRTRIANLIESRSILRQHFSEDNVKVTSEEVCNMDKDFVTQVHKYIEKKYANPDLNVEVIASEMGFSRVQLYRKLKSLTNYSPNEMVRIYRLKKARTLLSSTDSTVAEIAYATGFSSPSYFTKCYKDYFGETPTARLDK